MELLNIVIVIKHRDCKANNENIDNIVTRHLIQSQLSNQILYRF